MLSAVLGVRAGLRGLATGVARECRRVARGVCRRACWRNLLVPLCRVPASDLDLTRLLLNEGLCEALAPEVKPSSRVDTEPHHCKVLLLPSQLLAPGIHKYLLYIIAAQYSNSTQRLLNPL